MDKNAIKKFAVWARTELIARVSLKGVEYGITEDNMVDANADSVGGKVLTADEKAQRKALIAEINDKGYKQVMEEVAYTWFNRFSALRFMEVNGYLPSHVRVFTDEENNFKPQIISEAIHLELDGLDMEKVYALKEAEKTEELYKYLLIVQCNALNTILPGMFQKLSDYTELLLPDNLLREGSVIQQMIELIPEEDWKDAVQIIGWLYQYYNSEKKDDVFAALKKNVKITKENIPAATQLFTPDWIVRYMVENSLGRLWVEGHPNDELKSQWKYYLEEAEQEPEVQTQLAEIRKEYATLTPDQLKVIDPCSGSGHILAYMFDVLMQIYESYGYTTREAVASIVENNLYGLDIDDRAAQLAYFAVMMKARQYDRRFFSRKDEDGNPKVLQPHVYAITESGHTDKDGKKHKNYDEYALEYFCNGDAKLKKAMNTIISELHDAKEYGSILTMTPQDWSALYARFAEIKEDIHISREAALRELLPLVQTAQALAQQYNAVVTNPPYMSNRGMGDKLLDYVKREYPLSKSDLFSVFIERCSHMSEVNGFYAMITQPSILFLSSFDQLRERIVSTQAIQSVLHMGRGIFGIDFGSASFVIRKGMLPLYKGEYFRLHERTFQYIDSEDIKELYLSAIKNHEFTFNFSTYTTDIAPEEENTEIPSGKELRIHFSSHQKNFLRLPGCPYAYWVSDKMIASFGEKQIKDIANPRQGMATGENNRFLRLWQEVSIDNCDFNRQSREDAAKSGKKWFPYNKGGDFRKWYGNNEYLVNWADDGFEICNFKDDKGKLRSRPQNTQFYFKPSLTWSFVSSTSFGVRYSPGGALFDIGGSSVFPKDEDTFYLLGLLCSKLSFEYMKLQNPTMNFQVGNVANIPVIYDTYRRNEIEKIVEVNILISKKDWDSFETSWDFQHHPLLRNVPTIAKAFDQWQTECDDRFNQLKANEEELNRIFIDIYGLQDELTPEVEDKDVTVRKADLGRDIRSLISYAVGCMFGRYSLDVDGLAYAGGEWDDSKYSTFAADKDNIIPICDDEYFEDDIVGLFVKFVKTIYGADTLDENLKFIADALGGKGQPKDVIRNYFLNDFYSDHCKIYQKRPIYWLFDSGKKNGFKALIYMHRYQPDTIARIRTDYVHEQQARYRTALADLEQRIANASTGERVKLSKKLTTLQAQDTEIRAYEEKIHHLADQMISIDLDDGVKANYAIFQDVLAKIK